MKMTIKKVERINGDQVRNMCIKYDLYTRGTNEEYSNLLENLCGGFYEGLTNPTIKQVSAIASDIVKHSTIPQGIDFKNFMLNVMCLLGEYTTISYEEA